MTQPNIPLDLSSQKLFSLYLLQCNKSEKRNKGVPLAYRHKILGHKWSVVHKVCTNSHNSHRVGDSSSGCGNEWKQRSGVLDPNVIKRTGGKDVLAM